jgi:hypothetical protein
VGHIFNRCPCLILFIPVRIQAEGNPSVSKKPLSNGEMSRISEHVIGKRRKNTD